MTVRAGGLTPELIAGLERFGRDVRADGERVTLTVSDESALPAIARHLVSGGAELYRPHPPARLAGGSLHPGRRHRRRVMILKMITTRHGAHGENLNTF